MKWDTIYGSQLSLSAKKCYDAVLAGLAVHLPGTEIKFLYPNAEESLNDIEPTLQEALEAIYLDRPEFFWLPHKAPFSVETQGNMVTLRYQPRFSLQQCIRFQRCLGRELDELTEGITNESQWEQERIIYERVAYRYRYKKTGDPFDYCVAGPLLNGQCVCSGFVSILLLAFRRAGFPCFRVSGNGHAWVIVEIDGMAFHCDVTWDRPIEGNLSYSYFNMTDLEICKDHFPELPAHRPKCTCPKYSYYYYRNCQFSSSSEAVKYIRSAFRKGAQHLVLQLDSGISAQTVAEKALFFVRSGTYYYSINDRRNSLLICRRKEQ